MEFFAKSCVMPIVSFDTSFTIIQLLLLPDFKKRIKSMHRYKINGKISIFTRFEVLKLFRLIKSKAVAPYFKTRHQINP